MKVLLVSSIAPARDGSPLSQRAWHIARTLGEHQDVTLMTWGAERGDETLGDTCTVISLERRHLAPSPVDRVRRQVRHLGGGVIPPWIDHLKVTSQPAPAVDADVLVALDEAALPLVPGWGGPVVLQRLNVFGDTFAGLARHPASPPSRRLLAAVMTPAWRRFDRAIGRRASVWLATTSEQRVRLSAFAGDRRVHVVPHGVKVPGVIDDSPRGPIAVFVGAWDYEPNIAGLTWFIRRIWPGIRRAIPAASLRVVGRGGSERVRSLAGADGIELSGEVPSIAHALDGAAVGVAPLHAGSGIKTKTLEYLASGLPVVATPGGAEGAHDVPGVRIACTAQAFEAALRDVLSDPVRSRAAGLEGRAVVADRMPWSAPGEVLNEVLLETVGVRP